MLQRTFVASIRAACAVAVIIIATVARANAIPVFANGQGVSCETCHTTFPGMTRYGMMVMMSNFQILNRQAQDQALPASMRLYITSMLGNVDRKGSAQVSDLSLLAGGFLGKDFTWYTEQHIIADGQIGDTEQTWLSWNGLFGGTNSLQAGKFHTPFPFMPAHAWTISTYLLAAQTTGQNTFNPDDARWGVAFNGMSNEFMYNLSYLTGAGATNDALDFNKTINPRAVDFNVSYGGMSIPWSVGLVAMRGDAPLLDPDSGDYIRSEAWTREGVYGAYQDDRWHFQTMLYHGFDQQPDLDLANVPLNGYFFEVERDLGWRNHVAVRYDVASSDTLNRQYVLDVAHNIQPNLALVGEMMAAPQQRPQIALQLAFGGPYIPGKRILSDLHIVPSTGNMIATATAGVPVPPPASAATQPRASGNANNGAQLVQANGCAGCHGAALKGGGLGPALYGIEHRLADARIADFIVHPRAPMPNFGFTGAQVADIVAYLTTLDGGAANTQPVVTFSPATPTDQATITVVFPGTPPQSVTVLPVMHMGTGTHHTALVQLQRSPNDPHT
ncbi:MAG TPA: cytochrome c, partial [Candidatus Rubrimentiphilum sp.]|nr:cytochrome c [Candidatus Rubrimentiphilum sp.]